MKRVEELENLIKYHKALYYQGRPEISDDKYDKLESELQNLDPGNPVLQIVGTSLTSSKKIKHKHKMLSLNKTYKLEELKAWMGNEDVICTYKIDGVSCSLIYEDGRLVLAKTRGDGSFGEDITEKVLWIKNVPVKIDKPGVVEVRGEIFTEEDDFFHLSDEMVTIGLDKPSSQRNIVAGFLGRKDHVELCRFLSFKAFDLIEEPPTFKTELEKSHQLKLNGFDIPVVVHHKDSKKLENSLEDAKHFMSEGPYQIDGLVFSFNRLALQNELGETAHHPRYKMAFKFPGESKTTVLKKINWSISRNGILTPVGKIQPVELSGAMISNVTLHNYGLVRQYNLKKGDEIEIIRSGEVIPKFLNVVKSSQNKFEIPSECPVCHSKTEIIDIRIYCSNENCPGKLKEGILNYIQKIGFEDISTKRLDEMISSGMVTKISDLYKLKKEDFLKLDKVKDKLADKFVATIESSKNVELTKFLSALGIQGGAFNKCEKVVLAGYDSIEKILNLTVDQLQQIDGFAEKSASEFHRSLTEKFPLIKELINCGFKFEAEEKKETPITSKKICITGALSQKRSVIEGLIRENGGIVVSSVSKNTDILVTNDHTPNSSKFKKAIQLDKKVITEDELMNLMSS